MKKPSIKTIGALYSLIILIKSFLFLPFNNLKSLIFFITCENNLLNAKISSFN